jgi:hypothetical protein
MQRTKPPFRADHVGSLLRSAALKDARGTREKGEITAEQLKAIEDREIETRTAAPDPSAHQQEARRLRAASDDRALQVRAVAYQGDAEDDDPVAFDIAFPLRARGGAGGDLSVDG